MGNLEITTQVEYTTQTVEMYADDGTSIMANMVTNAQVVTVTRNTETGEMTADVKEGADFIKSDLYDGSTNCHGLTFSGESLSINDSEVPLLLKGDGYVEVNQQDSEITVFNNSDGQINHSAQRNPDGTYNSNDGNDITLYNTSFEVSRRGRGVDSSKDKHYKKPNKDKKVRTKAGEVSNRLRVISSEKDISKFKKKIR